MLMEPRIVLCAFFMGLVTLSEGLTREQLKKTGVMIRNTCIGKSKIENTELIDKFHVGDFAEDPSLKCYMKCVMGMMQAVKGNKLDIKLAKGVVDKMMPDDLKDPIKKAMDVCSNVADGVDDGCEIAFRFIKCLYNNVEDKDIINLFP